MGNLPVMFADPKTPVQTCLILSINKHRFSGFFTYGDCYFIYGKIDPFFFVPLSFHHSANRADGSSYEYPRVHRATIIMLEHNNQNQVLCEHVGEYTCFLGLPWVSTTMVPPRYRILFRNGQPQPIVVINAYAVYFSIRQRITPLGAIDSFSQGE